MQLRLTPAARRRGCLAMQLRPSRAAQVAVKEWTRFGSTASAGRRSEDVAIDNITMRKHRPRGPMTEVWTLRTKYTGR